MRNLKESFFPVLAGQAHQGQHGIVYQLPRSEKQREPSQLLIGRGVVIRLNRLQYGLQRLKDSAICVRTHLLSSCRGKVQFFQRIIAQRRHLTNGMPAIHCVAQQQQTADVGFAVQSAAPRPAGVHCLVTALPGAKRVYGKAGELGRGANWVLDRHLCHCPM